MPSAVHDVFIARVVEEIQGKLRKISDSENRSRVFVQKIKHNGTSRVALREDKTDGAGTMIRHDPDAAFKHEDAHWTGLPR